MFVPVPMLAVMSIAFLLLLALALRRRGGNRDLLGPPRPGSSAAWPRPGQASGAGPASASLPAEVEAEVRALAVAGRKIEAIKRVRAATGLGLAEAKDLIERM